MIKTFGFILDLSFHDSTNCYYISWNTLIDLIISKLAIYCLWHLSSIDIFDIIVYFLKSNSLKETCLCCMFLSNKESWMALNLRTLWRSSPFTINKIYLNFVFAIIAFKNNTFYKYFYRTYSQNCSSNTYKFVYQMTFDYWKGKLFVVVIELWNDQLSWFDVVFIKSNWV